MATVKGLRLPNRNRRLQGSFSKKRRGFDDASEWVDKPRNAGVRGARESQMIFDRPEHDHREMLKWGRRIPEPGIVRNRHEKLGTAERHPADKVGKDDFITNDYAELDGAGEAGVRGRLERQHDRTRPGLKIADAFHQLVEKEQQGRFQRNILAEGNQVLLVITAKQLALGR